MPDEHDSASSGGEGHSRPERRAKPGQGRRKKKEKKKYPSFTSWFWHEWVKPLGLILIVLGSFRTAVADWNDVPTGSMEPTIMPGDRIAVHKWVYGLHIPFTKVKWLKRWGSPERGDIVVCYSPADGTRLVKRVLAIPGDTIEIRNGRLVINGEAVEYTDMDRETAEKVGRHVKTVDFADSTLHVEKLPDSADGRDFAEHTVMYSVSRAQARNVPATEVPEDMYVTVGDNRDRSKDSRHWGVAQGQPLEFMPGDQIIGRAFGVAFSLNRDNMWLPRFDRFFRPLD